MLSHAQHLTAFLLPSLFAAYLLASKVLVRGMQKEDGRASVAVPFVSDSSSLLCVV